jgi:hypothetical protein
MAHTCSSLILHCIDFRFGSAIKQWMHEQEILDDCDMVAAAGAAKQIVDPVEFSCSKFMLDQIGISVRLHETKRIILMNHMDCGAYGGHDTFVSLDEEEAKYINDMRKAKAMVVDRFPDVVVELWLADIDSHGEIQIRAVE